MEAKRRITILNVAIAHLTSVMLLPIVWAMIGSLISWILIGTKTLPDIITNILYYLILIVSFYGGLKYSFWYVTKNLIVTQPKKSSKISTFIFCLGLILTYIAFYAYSGEHNYLRIGSFFLIAYLYITLTSKYFHSLEPENDLNEYGFLIQVGFTLVNFSLVIMLAILTIWILKEFPSTYILYTMFLASWFGNYGTKINNFLFVPYFYKDGEGMPYKKIIKSLSLSIPSNIFLFYMISQGAFS